LNPEPCTLNRACPQGIVFFLIIRPEQEKAIKKTFAPFAP